jgi:hypothetical protein
MHLLLESKKYLFKFILIFTLLTSLSIAGATENEIQYLLKGGLEYFDVKKYKCSIKKWERAIKDKSLNSKSRKRTIKMLIN